jgi:hypothetical protein
MFKKESYSLVDNIREECMRQLEIPPRKVVVDLFANHKNHTESLYCTRENSAWRYDWSSLRKCEDECIWANPPFSQLPKVVTKLCLEPTKMILVTPNWSGQDWARLLDKISIARVEIPSGTKLYVGDWEKRPLPSPPWNTYVSLVDTVFCQVPLGELDPKMVRQVQKASRAWNFEDLEKEVRKYPRVISDETMDKEVQVEGMGERVTHWLGDVPCGQHLDTPMDTYMDQHLDPPTHGIDLANPQIDSLMDEKPRAVSQAFEPVLPSSYIHSLGAALETSMDSQLIQSSIDDTPFFDQNMGLLGYLAELTCEIDTHFEEIGHIIQEVQVQVSVLGDQLVGEDCISAKATGKFPINDRDTKEIAKLVYDKIFELETKNGQ